jgi:hypothetical protein
VDPVIEAVNREHVDAAIEAAEDALSLGQASRILPALSLAVSMYPTNEVLCALLMRCLAGIGQRAAALEAFESLRVLLADQLGVSPGPVLAGAHLDVLRNTVEAAARPRGLPVPRQLPVDPVGFVGREDEIRELMSCPACPRLTRPLSRETPVLAAACNGEDKPASWHVQTGKDPVLPLFCENVAECLARVIDIREDAAAMQLL